MIISAGIVGDRPQCQFGIAKWKTARIRIMKSQRLAQNNNGGEGGIDGS